jgi:hypothetical protein
MVEQRLFRAFSPDEARRYSQLVELEIQLLRAAPDGASSLGAIA